MKGLTKKQWAVVMLERRAALIKKDCGEKNIFDDIIPALKQLKRMERQLQRLAELSCNGYPKLVVEVRDGKRYMYDVEDENFRAICEKKEARIENQVKQLAAEFNLTVEFQGDPRGCMFSLKTVDGVSIEVA